MNNPNELLCVLSDAEIHFVIIGGFAAVLHGSSQVTQDLDLCLQISKSTIYALRRALKPYHPVYRDPRKLSFLELPRDSSDLKNIYLKTDLGPLDILGDVKGVGTFEEVIKNAISVDLFGRKCFVMGLEDLLKSKLAMSRPKDELVIRELSVLHKR